MQAETATRLPPTLFLIHYWIRCMCVCVCIWESAYTFMHLRLLFNSLSSFGDLRFPFSFGQCHHYCRLVYVVWLKLRQFTWWYLVCTAAFVVVCHITHIKQNIFMLAFHFQNGTASTYSSIQSNDKMKLKLFRLIKCYNLQIGVEFSCQYFVHWHNFQRIIDCK